MRDEPLSAAISISRVHHLSKAGCSCSSLETVMRHAQNNTTLQMVACLPHSPWHNGQWDWEGGTRYIDMVRKHMHYLQESKTTESCISLNIMSNLHYTLNYSVLSTWEFGDCSPGNLGQCFIAKKKNGPHLTFQFHGKKSEVLLCFWSKFKLIKHTPEQKDTGENN